MRRARFAWVGASVGLLGCGGDEPPPGGTPQQPAIDDTGPLCRPALEFGTGEDEVVEVEPGGAVTVVWGPAGLDWLVVSGLVSGSSEVVLVTRQVTDLGPGAPQILDAGLGGPSFIELSDWDGCVGTFSGLQAFVRPPEVAGGAWCGIDGRPFRVDLTVQSGVFEYTRWEPLGEPFTGSAEWVAALDPFYAATFCP